MRLLTLFLVLSFPWPGAGQVAPSPAASFLGEIAEDHSGYPSLAGDINGDGYDDFLISAQSSVVGGYQSGQLYILFGKAAGWQIDLSLAQADASIIGQEWGEIGNLPTGVGDVNADGYDDFIFEGHVSDDAESYLVFGSESGWQMSSSLDSIDGVIFSGDPVNDHLAHTAGGGDIDGDGYDDFLIASDENGEVANAAGKVFLFFGRDSWMPDLGLDAADASFLGEAELDQAGRKTAGGGDVNGDGYDDVLVGATNNSEAGDCTGKAYFDLRR